MKELHEGPVIVLAPHDAVVVFATTEELLHDLEEMDFGLGQRSRYFATDGTELDLVQERGVVAIVRTRPRGAEPVNTAEPQDEVALREAVDRVLQAVWLGRFPRKPRWLHRVFYGKTPPRV